MIFIWIIILIVQTTFPFSFIIIAIINRLFFHFVIILEYVYIKVEGAKALAEALKLNKNLTILSLCIFFIEIINSKNCKMLTFLILINNSKNVYLRIIIICLFSFDTVDLDNYFYYKSNISIFRWFPKSKFYMFTYFNIHKPNSNFFKFLRDN